MGIYDRPKKDESWGVFGFLYKMNTTFNEGYIPVPGIQWLTTKEVNRFRHIYEQRKLTPKS